MAMLRRRLIPPDSVVLLVLKGSPSSSQVWAMRLALAGALATPLALQANSRCSRTVKFGYKTSCWGHTDERSESQSRGFFKTLEMAAVLRNFRRRTSISRKRAFPARRFAPRTRSLTANLLPDQGRVPVHVNPGHEGVAPPVVADHRSQEREEGRLACAVGSQ